MDFWHTLMLRFASRKRKGLRGVKSKNQMINLIVDRIKAHRNIIVLRTNLSPMEYMSMVFVEPIPNHGGETGWHAAEVLLAEGGAARYGIEVFGFSEFTRVKLLDLDAQGALDVSFALQTGYAGHGANVPISDRDARILMGASDDTIPYLLQTPQDANASESIGKWTLSPQINDGNIVAAAEIGAAGLANLSL